MIQAVVTIVVDPKKRNEMLKSMRSTVGPTRAQQGCVDCRVHIHACAAELLTLFQTWETRADLERYVRSDLYPTVLAIMESSLERPQVDFHTISKTEGLEVVENLRTSTP